VFERAIEEFTEACGLPKWKLKRVKGLSDPLRTRAAISKA
jgi:hypothetical protein